MNCLLPCYSIEDFSIYRTPKESNQIFAVWTSLYHPALIRHFGKMPSWDRISCPSPGKELGLVVIPPAFSSQVSAEWIRKAEKTGEGPIIIRDKETREEIVEAALAALGIDSFPDTQEEIETFYALGFSHFVSELFSRKLRYMSNLDTQRFTENGLKAAEALGVGDRGEYLKRIRRAFELLTESKEYFFPTAMKFLDLTVLSQKKMGDQLTAMLRNRAARNERTNLLISTWQLEQIRSLSPEGFELLKSEIEAGRVNFIGGDKNESPLYLMPVADIAERILDGWSTYFEAFGKLPAAFGRYEAGYTPILPQILQLTGCQNGLLFTEDGWRATAETQSRIDWKGPGGGKIAALSRPPLDGSSAKTFMEMPDRVGYSANGDKVLSMIFKHQPGEELIWFSDLSRMTQFAPVLGRVLSLSEYFKETNSAGTDRRFEKDAFRTNYLTRADRDCRKNPVSVWSLWRRLSAEMNMLAAVSLFAGLQSPDRSISRLPGFTELEKEAFLLDDLKSDLLAQITAPAAPALEGIEDEEERTIRDEEIHSSELQRLERIEKQVHSGEIPFSEELGRSFARLLEPKTGTGILYVNMTPQTVTTLSQTSIEEDSVTSPWVETKTVYGNTRVSVTLPPFSVLRLNKGKMIPAEPEPVLVSQPAKRPAFARLLEKIRGSEPVEDPSKMVRFHKEEFKDGVTERFYTISTKYYDLKIDADTGAVRSVRTMLAAKVSGRRGLLNQPGIGNRLAWQIAMKLSERRTAEDHRSENSGEYGYSLMSAEKIEVISDGPWEACLKITGHLTAPDGDRLASYEEVITASRDSRIIDVELTIRPDILPTEKPWDEYYGVRFAWNDNLAELRPGCHGICWETSRDYFQAPDFLDIRSEEELGVTILSNGLPFYLRCGGRMADSVLIPRGESERTFRFGIGIDLSDPVAEAAQYRPLSPILLDGVPCEKPSLTRFLEVSPGSVAVQQLTPLYEQADSEIDPQGLRLNGFRILLQETSAEKAEVEIRSLFPIVSATPVNLLGQPNGDPLEVKDGSSVLLPMKARQVTAIDLRLG